MRDPVRTFSTGDTSPSVMDRQAREATTQARGDRVVTSVLSVDDEGRPTGNRRERRMAAREIRRRR